MTCPSDAPHGRGCKSVTTRPPSVRPENHLRKVAGSAVPSRENIKPSERNVGSSPVTSAAKRVTGPSTRYVGDRDRWAIGPLELFEGVELHGAAEDVAV